MGRGLRTHSMGWVRRLPGFVSAALLILGLAGMHGLPPAHAMPTMAATVHAAATGHNAPGPMGAGGCCPRSACPAMAAGAVCAPALLPAPGAHNPVVSSADPLRPGTAQAPGAGFSYRGPPPSPPSLHQLSISRT